MTDDERDNLVEIKTFPIDGASQAFALSTYLNSFGVEVSVWESDDHSGGYVMMVPEQDVAQARKLLADLAKS